MTCAFLSDDLKQSLSLSLCRLVRLTIALLGLPGTSISGQSGSSPLFRMNQLSDKNQFLGSHKSALIGFLGSICVSIHINIGFCFWTTWWQLFHTYPLFSMGNNHECSCQNHQLQPTFSPFWMRNSPFLIHSIFVGDYSILSRSRSSYFVVRIVSLFRSEGSHCCRVWEKECQD